MKPANWANPNYSFDNVFKGMLTLYEVSTLEGWLDVMYSSQDMTVYEEQPEQDYSALQFWYICLYIGVMPFFIINLVVGVIIEKFNQVSGRGLLTQEQRMYKDTLLQAMLHDSSKPLDRPEGYISGVCYAICTNQQFETVILVLVVANSALMGSQFYDQPEALTNLVNMMNMVFTAIFTVECAVKLTGMGPNFYFKDGWNCLDFTVVVGSLIMIPLDGVINLQALRPFRLLVIFRMIRRAKGIRLMVTTLLLSLPALFNVTCLLSLAFFIYAVLGMSLYANIKFGDTVSPTANFRRFDDSLLLMSRMVTGEAWNSIMHNCMVTPPECTDFFGQTFNGWGNLEEQNPRALDGFWLPNDCGLNGVSIVFFITFQIVGNYMVLNLFVAVILDNYAYMANVGDAELNEFVLEKFKKTWYRFTLKDAHANVHLGQYIRLNKIRDFLDALGSPLGVVVWDKKGIAKYKLVKEECRRVELVGSGVSYRQMQYILALQAMSEDPACDMPVEEKEERDAHLNKIKLEKAAAIMQALYRGGKGRAALGVDKGAQKSQSELQANAFKKRFATMMNNPGAVPAPPKGGAMAIMPPSGGSQAQPASLPAAASAGVGIPMQAQGGHAQSQSTNATEQIAADTNAVKNVFRERAAQRAMAKASKGPT